MVLLGLKGTVTTVSLGTTALYHSLKDDTKIKHVEWFEHSKVSNIRWAVQPYWLPNLQSDSSTRTGCLKAVIKNHTCWSTSRKFGSSCVAWQIHRTHQVVYFGGGDEMGGGRMEWEWGMVDWVWEGGVFGSRGGCQS